MPWPNSDLIVLDDETAGAFSTGIQANFAAPDAGRLLLAFYSNDPDIGGGRTPDEAGWTEEWFFSNTPTYLWSKVSDGTETTVTVSHGTLNQETTLTVVSINAELSSLQGPTDQDRPAPETMVVTGTPINTRLDFAIGDDAPANAPSTGSPAVQIANHAGAAFRRANSFYAIPLGPQAVGASIPGQTYIDANSVGNGIWSFLLKISSAWGVGFVRAS